MLSRSTGVARAVSSVPFLRALSDFPFNQLRKVPGMYVALGVTAYQVAAMTEAATVAGLRARSVVTTVVDSVSGTLEHLFSGVEDRGQSTLDVAKQAARGAMHSLDEMSVNVGFLTRQTVLGVVKGLSGRKDAGKDALSGAVYGAVQGAHETGASMSETVTHAVEAAKEAASATDMDEATAVRMARNAALDAGRDLGPEAHAQVRAALEPSPSGDAVGGVEGAPQGKQPGPSEGRGTVAGTETAGAA
jgi:hypothetical protein